MKLHIPVSLRKVLLSLFACSVTVAEAGLMHEDVAISTYTDFGQNKGRYVVGERVNALLEHIRTQDGGITINYTDGSSSCPISNEQGMISFAGTGDNGAYAAIAPNAMVTVRHNQSNDASYGEREVGANHAINYSAIDIDDSSFFRLLPDDGNGGTYDYMIQRQSKIVTDAVYNPLTDVNDVSAFKGEYLYHSGAGLMGVYKEGSGDSSLAWAYVYTIGGINTITDVWNGSGNNSVITSPGYGNGLGASQANPLPNGIQAGDSGSPVYIYNSTTGSYEYVAAQQSGSQQGGNGWSQARGNVQWTRDTLESFNTRVSMNPTMATVYLNAIDTQGETKSDGTNSAILYSGAVTDSAGNTLARYNGVQSGMSTWRDLSAVKDLENWYAYDSNAYLQRSDTELFFSNNLVFNSTADENEILLNATVDLGIGYAEFNGGKYIIRSAPESVDGSGGNQAPLATYHQFNHAGYVINEGAEVHVRLVAEEGQTTMAEWRKSGAGDLYIDGNGSTNAMLNLGGSGTVYLQQDGGYAAYNVLANTGSRVVIKDLSQIERDFTSGVGGATLDMNGNSMDWYRSTDAAGRFTINALTEEALITNSNGNTTLTYKEGGNTTWLGSFLDSNEASLAIDYQGGGTLNLHSIRTNLSNNAASGFTVSSGTVVLAGTHTVHGKGSESGTNANRLLRDNDWHYADAAMNVSVKKGAAFELGSHARLTGTVTMEEGGTYTMHEGVAHAQEYVEGGAEPEDTAPYQAFYGHKGNVELKGGNMLVQFSEGVDTATKYSGNISGTGALTVAAGSSGSLILNGAVSAGVSRTLESGELILSGAAADNVGTQWLVKANGALAQTGSVADTLALIDPNSTGTLALNQDTATQLTLGQYSAMVIGAQHGSTVQYGAAGTSEQLDTSVIFGGRGKLLVNAILSGADTLTIDGRGLSGGEISLQQVADGYNGTINIGSEGGHITLSTGQYAGTGSATINVNDGGIYSGTLSGATVNINNGGIYKLADNQISREATVKVNSGGILKDMVKSGGFIELYGQAEYDNLVVQDGATLNLRDGGRLDADHAATITGTGIMRLNLQSLQDKVNLENGGIMYGNGGTIASTATVLATEGIGKLSAGGGTFNINGTIGAKEGATLRLENGTINLYSGNINADGGTLELACSTVNLGHKVTWANQNIGGILSIVDNVTINTDQTSLYYQTTTHNINHLHIADGKKLTLVEPNTSWNHVYNLSELTGSGEIHWKSNIYWYHGGPSRLVLTGDNSFSGSLIVEQMNNYGSLQHVSLAHENAAKNMVINLWGDGNSHPGLAISTETARVAGIGGTVNTFVYAGAVKTEGNQDNPTSKSLNTLIINTAGENHIYNGTLLGDSANGLHIVKEGAGSQTFTGSDNVVHDIQALQGSLIFTNAPTVNGDIALARGANLQVGTSLNLASGQSLTIMGESSSAGAVLNSELCFNGGSLVFDSKSLNSSTAALQLQQGISVAEGVSGPTVTFTDNLALMTGATYLLSSGDWSGLNIQYSLPEYVDGGFNAGSEGLSFSASMKDGYAEWNGNIEEAAQGKTLILTAPSVQFSQAAQLTGLIMDSSADYTLSGSELTVGRLSVDNSTVHVTNTVTTSEFNVVNGNVIIESTGTMNLSYEQSGTVALANISGAGNLGLKLSAQYGNTILLGSDFTGTTHVQQGNFTINGSTFGNTLHLANGVNFQLTGGSTVTMNKDLVLDGTSQVHQNRDANLTIYGSVTGAGTYERLGGGTLSMNGTVNLGAFIQNTNATTQLNGNTDLGKLDVLAGTISIAGNTESGHAIGDISLSGNGTSLHIGGNNSQQLKGNISVGSGSTLFFTGDGQDIMDYNAAKALTVDGGTVDFGTTRQTLQDWTLTLKNGATLSGTGDTYNIYGAQHTAAMDLNKNSTIIVESGITNTVSATTRLRNGTTLTYNVAENAAVTVSGRIHADNQSGKGVLVKDGDGKMTISHSVNLATLNLKRGETILSAANNQFGLLDGAMSGSARGTLRLAEDASLKITGAIWGRSAGAIVLEEGASLTSTQRGVIISNRNQATEARITNTSSSGSEYSLSNKDFVLSGAHLQYDSSKNATISNKLLNSSVENMNQGGNTLTIDNSENSISGLTAATGDIVVLNMSEINLKELELAASMSLSAYAGNVTTDASQEAKISVSSTAIFGESATLNADLVLKSGATLESNGTVQMGSDVTLQTGLTLSGALYEASQSLTPADKVVLFRGIDNLYLGNSSTPSRAFGLSDAVAANDYFSNLADNLFLVYDTSAGAGEGELSIQVVVPEPTTATLSLLALAGLAARRRRASH